MALRQWLGVIVPRWRKRSNYIPHQDSSNIPRSITRLWTCGGKFFGYRLDDALFTYSGHQAGQFAEGDEIYDSSGGYIGELHMLNRLITNMSKTTWHRTPYLAQGGARFKRSGDLESIRIRPGYEDFPSPMLSE